MKAAKFKTTLMGVVTCIGMTAHAGSDLKFKQVVIGQNQDHAAILCPDQKIERLWYEQNLAPKGCASITESGALKEQGIQYVLHAATGSMRAFDESTDPTLDSIAASVKASILLAKKQHVKKIAIPLIGGKIFLSRIKMEVHGQAVEDLDQKSVILAQRIISAANEVDSGMQYAFVAFTAQDAEVFSKGFKGQQDARKRLERIKNWFQNHFLNGDFARRSEILQGNILDVNLHHASAIVNPANMELEFGGGLSGAIAGATKEADKIDQINKSLIEAYYREVSHAK